MPLYLCRYSMAIRTCPRCSEPLHRGYQTCSFCSFSLRDADSTFGSKRVRLQRVVDASKSISPVDAEKLDRRISRFEADFPQLLFAAYVAHLPENVNLRELGFWLINRAILDSPRSNDSAILLCVNSRHLSASISLGYLPEQHLDEFQLSTTLEQASPYLSARRFAPLIASCLNSISHHLRQEQATPR